MQVGNRNTFWPLFALGYPWGSLKILESPSVFFAPVSGSVWAVLPAGKDEGSLTTWIKNPRFVFSALLLSLVWRFKAGGAMPSLVCLLFPVCPEKQTFHLKSNIAQYLHSRWNPELSKNPINTQLEQMKPTSSLQNSCSCLPVLSKCCKSYCRNTEYFHRKHFPSP